MANNTTDMKSTRLIHTTRFGEIEVAEKELIFFSEGLLGFNTLTQYVLLKDPEQDPFLWMQSIENPDLAFVVVDPFIFFPGYEIQVKSHELLNIELKDVSKANTLVILTIPEDPMALTANLRGPIVINPDNGKAKQFVLIDDRYHTRHYLLKDIPDYLAMIPTPDQITQHDQVNQTESEQSGSSQSHQTKSKRSKRKTHSGQ